MENILVYLIHIGLPAFVGLFVYIPPFACDEVQSTLKSSPWVSGADTPSWNTSKSFSTL